MNIIKSSVRISEVLLYWEMT